MKEERGRRRAELQEGKRREGKDKLGPERKWEEKIKNGEDDLGRRGVK